MGRQPKLERIVKSSIDTGNDLELLVKFATHKGKEIGVRYPKKYSEEVVDVYLTQYYSLKNSKKYQVFSKGRGELYARQKALWLAYKKAYEEAGMDTSSWVYSPGQRTLDE